MQATVEVLSGLERKIIIKTPSERVEQEIEKRLKNLANKVKMDGFRPGKAPIHLVRAQYGESLRHEVLDEVIDSTYKEAITQEKLLPVSMPKIEFLKNDAGEPLEYAATIEVYPEVKLASLESVSIENPDISITEADVTDMIEKLRKQAAEWETVARPSQKGDRVIVSFEGRLAGELFEGGTAKHTPIELGAGETIPGFEDGLFNRQAGDKVDMDLTFPADYRASSLAGKPVTFSVTVHEIKQAKLPELNDDFAQKFGITDGGITQLRKEVEENMQRDVKQKTREVLKAQLLEKVSSVYNFELPKAMIAQEIHKLQQQEAQYAAKRGTKLPSTPEHQTELVKIAQERIKLGLIFAEFIRTHHLRADPERIQTLLEEIAANYNQPESIISQYRNDKNAMASLQETVIEDQAVELMLKQAKLVNKTMSYAEFKGFKLTQEN